MPLFLGANLDRGLLQWANSLSDRNVTEIAVLSPVRKGRVSGERQTFEQRARSVVNSIQQRVKAGIPQVLAKVPSIHFGRIIFLRPEQYMDTAGLSDDEQPGR